MSFCSKFIKRLAGLLETFFIDIIFIDVYMTLYEPFFPRKQRMNQLMKLTGLVTIITFTISAISALSSNLDTSHVIKPETQLFDELSIMNLL